MVVVLLAVVLQDLLRDFEAVGLGHLLAAVDGDVVASPMAGRDVIALRDQLLGLDIGADLRRIGQLYHL